MMERLGGSAQAQPFLFGDTWCEVRDGNPSVAALFDRHYSRLPGSRGNVRVVGPGERMVLLTPCARATFVWRRFINKDPSARPGDVNCAIFRNEGAGRSSDLIRAAMALAWARWPGVRLYTYVNAERVRSPNPGYCFVCAGWCRCGTTKKRRLIILEAFPPIGSH